MGAPCVNTVTKMPELAHSGNDPAAAAAFAVATHPRHRHYHCRHRDFASIPLCGLSARRDSSGAACRTLPHRLSAVDRH